MAPSSPVAEGLLLSINGHDIRQFVKGDDHITRIDMFEVGWIHLLQEVSMPLHKPRPFCAVGQALGRVGRDTAFMKWDGHNIADNGSYFPVHIDMRTILLIVVSTGD